MTDESREQPTPPQQKTSTKNGAPKEEKKEEKKAQPTKTEDDSAAKPKEIALIIEDDFDASIIFARALEANGYITEQIYDGGKARERLAEGTVPHIILLDMHLPNVQGKDLLKEIRADERFAKSRMIVVTADSGMADMIRDQADLVLLKPTTYTQVRDFTARLLRRLE